MMGVHGKCKLENPCQSFCLLKAWRLSPKRRRVRLKWQCLRYNGMCGPSDRADPSRAQVSPTEGQTWGTRLRKLCCNPDVGGWSTNGVAGLTRSVNGCTLTAFQGTEGTECVRQFLDATPRSRGRRINERGLRRVDEERIDCRGSDRSSEVEVGSQEAMGRRSPARSRKPPGRNATERGGIAVRDPEVGGTAAGARYSPFGTRDGHAGRVREPARGG